MMHDIFPYEFVTKVDAAFTSVIGIVIAVVLVVIIIAQLLPEKMAGGSIFKLSSLQYTLMLIAAAVLFRFVLMLMTWEALGGLTAFIVLILIVLQIRKKSQNNTPKNTLKDGVTDEKLSKV